MCKEWRGGGCSKKAVVGRKTRKVPNVGKNQIRKCFNNFKILINVVICM